MSATWENWTKETNEISDGIQETVKTYSSGCTEVTYQIKVNVRNRDVWVDAVEVNGSYESTEEGLRKGKELSLVMLLVQVPAAVAAVAVAAVAAVAVAANQPPQISTSLIFS